MDRLLTLEDIALCPAVTNSGNLREKYNFAVRDEIDGTVSLPIFTSPMEAIVSKDNWSDFDKAGIRPILPQSENINIRLEGCQFIFAAFTIEEVVECFIKTKRSSNNVFRICIDAFNGHDSNIFNIAVQLRKIYGNQVNIMAGNIGNAKTYIDYCKAGIDYVRVGFGTGSIVDTDKYGFYYPLASLLIDILGIKNTSCTGLKQTKIIADGGILYPTDILKCISLGADYIMGGRIFARLIESAGKLYQKTTKGLEEITKNALEGLSRKDIMELSLVRHYGGITPESRTDKISVKNNLADWSKDLFDCFNYGFTLANATDWKTFKTNIRYCRVQ